MKKYTEKLGTNSKDLLTPISVKSKNLMCFKEGYFTTRKQDLKSEGISHENISRIISHFKYYKNISNSGQGFLAEWGYWMMLQALDMYQDGFSYAKDVLDSAPPPLLRVNAQASVYPINSCCFLPGKVDGNIKNSDGERIHSNFPYTCNWQFGATPDIYIGPRLDYMNIDLFKNIQNSSWEEGYRIIEIKSVARIFNEFVPLLDSRGNPIRDAKNHYIPKKDSQGNTLLTGSKIVKVNINGNTHKNPEELILVAHRGKKNMTAEHLGFITLGELQEKREGSYLSDTPYIKLEWLNNDIEDLYELLIERLHRYQKNSRQRRSA